MFQRRWWIGAGAAVVAGCIGEAPRCEVPAGAVTAMAECGPDDDIPTQSGEERDGMTWLHFATCDEAWEARCDPGRLGGGTRLTAPVVCASADAASSCASGSPRCVAIPCDGETHLGADHPDAP